MNKINFENEFRMSGWVKNDHYLARYLKFIDAYKTKDLKKNIDLPGEFENHHILPDKLWPQFNKEKCNIVCLPTRAHFIAHYMLYKFLARNECVFAFNQMRRYKKFIKARMYEQIRKDIGILIKQINSGKKWSNEQYAPHSAIHKGKNTYKNKTTNEHKKFIIGEEPEGWVPAQIGRVKSKKAKQQLSTKMKDRKWQYNPLTKEILFDKILHDGYIFGYPEWIDNGSQALKEYKWAYDPVTGKVVRCKENEIPNGYTIGRKYDNKGFEKINNPEIRLVIDKTDMTYKYVKQSILPNDNYISVFTSIDKMFSYEYKGKIFYSWDQVEKHFPELPKIKSKRNISILDEVIPKKHHNQTQERQKFCEEHAGKTFGQIGLIIKHLKE